MKKILFLLAALAFITRVQAQGNLPVRLAIVPETTGTEAVADMLTAEFSQNDQVHLLERAEIERVYREQGLSAVNRDDLKLGRLLGADGVLVVGISPEGAAKFLTVRLVAVRPGVVLVSERFSWPMEDPTEWTRSFTKHLAAFLPKLTVLERDAIPISVVNLRSAIQSAEGREAERQLTLLCIERLSRERRLFVLERRKMQLLTAEKEFNGFDESAFWEGSYLLDGTLDNGGYARDTITISARLIPPRGGAPIPIEVNGSRTNLTEVINRLADQVQAKLKTGVSATPWNAADEAGQFYAEAQWAMKWNLYPQAQAAAESAWALGRRTPDSARLLIRAYAETLPDQGMNPGDLPVFQVPDAREFAALDRGLDFFARNAPLLFAGTNSFASFNLALRLLRPALGQLESYYYAAEQRAGQADELSQLREKVLQMFTVLDNHPPVVPNPWLGSWSDPRLNYARLKWDEGGIAFDRPEDALKFYEHLLAGGTIHEKLPRIIGWTWADRQRVPALVNRFVNDARASTNVVARLEGLYSTLLLVPDGAAGSVRRAEEELESAMWKNREVLFQNADNAALVEFTRNALIKKLEGDNVYVDRLYDHEPFASFNHRLRMDFLSGNMAANVAVLQQLLPCTNVKMETPEQARELLPLVSALTHRVPADSIDCLLSLLRRAAGAPAPPVAPLPALKAKSVLEAKFVPWQVAHNLLLPRFSGMIWRNDALWMCVHYHDRNTPDAGQLDLGQSFPTSYLAVDPQRGVKEEIPFPDKLGQPGDLFEVSRNSLFVEASGQLWEYAFRERTWTEIPVPMEGVSGLVWLDGRLFVGRNDGLLEADPESQKVTLLVSARRRPAANAIDPLWTPLTKIFPQADGRLGALAEGNFLVLDPATERWEIRPLPLTGTNMFFNMFADYFSPGGALRLLTGPFARRYLIGFWNDGPAESLLMEPSGITSFAPAAEKLLPPVRWDWPKKYPMEQSQITVEGKTLWALAPCRWEPGATGPKSVEFADQRDATLLRFTPDARSPLSVPVRFPIEGLPNPLPTINGQPTNVLDAHNFGYWSIFQRFAQRAGNMAFWLRVPGGLVFGGPYYCGDWFIADSALKEMPASSGAAQPNPSRP